MTMAAGNDLPPIQRLGLGTVLVIAGSLFALLFHFGSPLPWLFLVGMGLGYGARLAYGCNIGAFFSGVASTSLHGWVWILAGAVGNIIGVRLRPLLHLDRGTSAG